MIVFITSQDAPTADNLVVAGHLVKTAPNALLAESATRAKVIPALQAVLTEPFLAFSHGEPDQIRGHDNKPAVTIDDVALLVQRETFALACHTATTIGREVAKAGGTWFGYAGPINCLPADSDTLPYFTSIADFIASRFPGCTTTSAANTFIDDLDALTQNAFNFIEATGTLEQLHALRDLTRRLRIWLPNAAAPLQHAEASPEPFL